MVPEAQWIALDGLGHCPMLDDAQLTAKTILEFIQRADVQPIFSASSTMIPSGPRT